VTRHALERPDRCRGGASVHEGVAARGGAPVGEGVALRSLQSKQTNVHGKLTT
jgi:hypothetical protein